MKINIRPLVFAIVCTVAIFVLGHPASAANQQPSGITVSPAFQQVTLAAGADKQPVSFTITNDKSSTETVSLSVADFNTLNESGGLFFVGTNPTALQQKYGLAKWVSLPFNKLTIAAKKTVTIQADILNLPTLAPGGHYGALMIELASGQSGGNTIGVKPIASSLIFLTKQPGDTHMLSLSNVYVKHSLISLPKTVGLRFYNNGNTHVVPRGVVQLIGPQGQVVGQGIINQNSGLILPLSYRIYQVNMNQIGSASQVGSYKLVVNFRFDDIDKFRSYQTSFAYIPALYLAIATVFILSLVTIVIVIIRKRRRNKKRIIKIAVK